MDTMSAFAMGEANRGKRLMILDWDEAARRVVTAGVRNASAGLRSDWEYTGGEILLDGKPVDDSDFYNGSTWAEPELDVGEGPESCWKFKNDAPDGWDGNVWPESAKRILREGK